MAGFKLTKAQCTERDGFAKKLSDASDKVVDAVAEYNATLEAAREFCVDIAQLGQDEWDDKSEKWQESDRGTDCGGWIDQWRDVDLEAVEEPEFPHGAMDELPESAA